MVWPLPGGRGRTCRARPVSIVGIASGKLHYVYGLNNQGRESSRDRCTHDGKNSKALCLTEKELRMELVMVAGFALGMGLIGAFYALECFLHTLGE